MIKWTDSGWHIWTKVVPTFLKVDEDMSLRRHLGAGKIKQGKSVVGSGPSSSYESHRTKWGFLAHTKSPQDQLEPASGGVDPATT